MTRTAISPRLAMRTLENTAPRDDPAISRRILRRCPRPSAFRSWGACRIHHFAELDSTNRYLLEEGRRGATEGLVAVADVQTAGRGRLDRRWEAPPGSSLLVSVLLRSAPEPGRAVMAAGVALARAVGDVATVVTGLKWPNDLVVGDRKLAGILAEREGDALVVGAGCNVNWNSFPPELAATATACNLEAGREVDRDALLRAYLGGAGAGPRRRRGRRRRLPGPPGDPRPAGARRATRRDLRGRGHRGRRRRRPRGARRHRDHPHRDRRRRRPPPRHLTRCFWRQISCA